MNHEMAALQAGLRAPLYLVWEITLRCNARCVHCYSGAGLPHPLEFTTEEALNVVDQLADAQVMILGLSGGEALLRPDWPLIAARARSRGMLVSIGTNGAAINEEMVRKIKEAGVNSICVSLDGASPEVHEQIRLVPGLFNRAVKAIELLVKHGVSVTVGYTPTRLNFRDGRNVVKLAHALGAQGANLSEFVPTGRGDKRLALEPHELREVIQDWIDMQREYAGRLKVYWHDCRVSLMLPDDGHKYIGCGAGKVTARITVEGNVTPCVSLPMPAGNLRQQRFQEIWDSAPFLQRIRNRENLSGNCGTCNHKMTCGGCRSVSLAYHDDPMMGDPFCWIAPDSVTVAEGYAAMAERGDS